PILLRGDSIPVKIRHVLMRVPVMTWEIRSLVVLLLIVIGKFMETRAGIIILAPILVRIVAELGINPVHFGIIMILAAEIGFLTPPVGDNLNVASAISGLSLEKVAKSTLPFTIVLIVLLFVFTFIEPVSMFLPELLSGITK